jgi:hypothetical protein
MTFACREFLQTRCRTQAALQPLASSEKPPSRPVGRTLAVHHRPRGRSLAPRRPGCRAAARGCTTRRARLARGSGLSRQPRPTKVAACRLPPHPEPVLRPSRRRTDTRREAGYNPRAALRWRSR